LDVHGAIVFLVQPPQRVRAVVDGPQAIADFLQADPPALEDGADEDEPGLPADVVDLRDEADLEVGGIFVLDRPAGQWPERGLIEIGWRLLVQSLVRPLLVEDVPEGVEGLLLAPEVGAGRTGGLAFESPMHALVSAVLLGLPGLDEVGCDPEIQPPRRELGEPSEGDGGSEGGPVVRADSAGQAMKSEEPKERGLAAFEGRSREPATIQKEAGVGVLDGEGVAEVPVAGFGTGP
jgi:hypothetical protein